MCPGPPSASSSSCARGYTPMSTTTSPKFSPLTECVFEVVFRWTRLATFRQLSAWKAITTLPHALESTLSLLVVVTHDASHSHLSDLLLRQSYATAIIRLVNGLVDPLQLGTYARSIASIAKQLGLPLWLVELRHAATHEELPSLSLLREAARQVW